MLTRRIFFCLQVSITAEATSDERVGGDVLSYVYAKSPPVDKEVESPPAPPKKRKKRFVALMCLNFPDCCNFRGRERCGFACPMCPKKCEYR